MKSVFAPLVLWGLWRLCAAFMLNIWHLDFDPKFYFICTFLLTFGCILHGGFAWSTVRTIQSRPVIWAVILAGVIGFAPLQIDGPVWSELTLVLRIVAAMAIGLWIGFKIEQPSYLWPLVMVGLTMDVASILWSGSFTQSVVQSVTVMPTVAHPLLIYTPTGALHMPLFGLADSVFCMMFVGAAQHLALSKIALLRGLWIGGGLGLAVLLWTASPVPLLPFLGVCGAGSLGRSVAPERKDLLQTAVFLGASALIFILLWLK